MKNKSCIIWAALLLLFVGRLTVLGAESGRRKNLLAQRAGNDGVADEIDAEFDNLDDYDDEEDSEKPKETIAQVC